MKKITIRLYRQHDMDLLSLYMNDGFDFQKEMKNAVSAMIGNREYMIEVPEYKAERMYLRRMYLIHITLTKDDAEIRAKLPEIRQGQICSFFKAAMRACLSSFPYGAYFGGDGFALSKAEETEIVNTERQAEYEKSKKTEKKPESKPAAKPEAKAPEEKPAERPAPKPAGRPRPKPVVIPEEDPLPDPIPFENLPVPEPEDTDIIIDDGEDDMDIFNAIDAVAGGKH